MAVETRIILQPGWEEGKPWNNIIVWGEKFSTYSDKDLKSLKRNLSSQCASFTKPKLSMVPFEIQLEVRLLQIKCFVARHPKEPDEILFNILAYKASKLHGIDEELILRCQAALMG